MNIKINNAYMLHCNILYGFFLQARRALGDFGLFIAIILMVLFDHFLADTFTQVR